MFAKVYFSEYILGIYILQFLTLFKNPKIQKGHNIFKYLLSNVNSMDISKQKKICTFDKIYNFHFDRSKSLFGGYQNILLTKSINQLIVVLRSYEDNYQLQKRVHSIRHD